MLVHSKLCMYICFGEDTFPLLACCLLIDTRCKAMSLSLIVQQSRCLPCLPVETPERSSCTLKLPVNLHTGLPQAVIGICALLRGQHLQMQWLAKQVRDAA